MKLMDSNIRKQIDEAIEKAASLANSGMSPNDAITKVASENGYNPDIGRLMARNFNITKTLAHFDTFRGDYEKKASDFDVADAEVVASRLQKDLEKKAVKKASVPKNVVTKDHLNGDSVDVNWFMNKYCTKTKVASEKINVFEFEEYLRHKTKVQEKLASLKSKAGVANTKAQDYMSKLADLARNTLDFHTVEADVSHALGEKIASMIFDSIEHLVPFEEFKLKRASGPSNVITYKQAVELAENLVSSLDEHEHFNRGYEELKKHASVTTHAVDEVIPGYAVGSGITDALQSTTHEISNLLDSAVQEASKPKEVKTNPDLRIDKDVAGELGTAKASLILSDILSNDEVLSEEDPVLVSNIAKQQLELNPNLLKYPAVLAGAIRRAVATRGDIDSHEGKQLIHIHRAPGETDD